MLTRIKIKNFKKLVEVDIELGKMVVFIGPNNSGKTTALQAISLWDTGLKLWNMRRSGKTYPKKRPGVTINRRDVIAIPVPVANLLWHDMCVRNVERVEGKPRTQNVLIEIVVDGVTNDKSWTCGLEFYYANDESFYCRPLRTVHGEQPQRMPVPEEVSDIRIAFLPPMSGLVAIEPKWEPGRINVLIGEGQTAQVLRNLCYQIYEKNEPKGEWHELVSHVKKLFGVTLIPPQYIKERGEISMSYTETGNFHLDISSSGRGLQQTLLLLAHLYAHPHTVLLLDEPDAHLEILRQRQTYQLLTEVSEKMSSQIIAASHSEVVLNEAAGRDIVVAFVGKPHRIDDRSRENSQVLKSLKEIGFEHYYQAEETGWVLYLEGSTDLAILKTFADILEHKEAQKALDNPFVHYIANQPGEVRKHFWGLKYAKSDLVGIALFDRLDKPLPDDMGAVGLQWKKRELENYFCMEEVLLAYTRCDLPPDLFGAAEASRRVKVMQESISEITAALKTLKRLDPWSPDIKATDDFLNPLFDRYFEKLGLPNLLRKTNYHVLTRLIPKDKIDPEITEKLNAIVEVSRKAKPKVD